MERQAVLEFILSASGISGIGMSSFLLLVYCLYLLSLYCDVVGVTRLFAFSNLGYSPSCQVLMFSSTCKLRLLGVFWIFVVCVLCAVHISEDCCAHKPYSPVLVLARYLVLLSL